MDEFLLLVKKTKKKYKDLLEKERDIENLNRAKLNICQKSSLITNDNLEINNPPHVRSRIPQLQVLISNK